MGGTKSHLIDHQSFPHEVRGRLGVFVVELQARQVVQGVAHAKMVGAQGRPLGVERTLIGPTNKSSNEKQGCRDRKLRGSALTIAQNRGLLRGGKGMSSSSSLA